MKYLALLVFSLFSIQANANNQAFSSSNQSQTPKQSSINVSQQTGGNYIYVENGKLTFNLEPSLFENRTWKFDQKTDAAVVAFETNLPLKTKNSSNFHVYELVMGYKIYELTENGEMKFVRATIEKPPKGGLMHPVYTPKAGKGQTYHVWLPALVWTVRIVGAVARQVVPPIINRAVTACAANPTCLSRVGGVTVTAAWLCALNYSDPKTSNHDGSLCKKAKEKGWKPNAPNSSSNTTHENDHKLTYKYTVYGYFGSKELHEKCPECVNDFREFRFGVDSEEEAWQKLREKCYAITQFADKVESSTWFGLSGEVKESLFSGNLYDRHGGMCWGKAEDEDGEFHFTAFRAWLKSDSYEETMQIVDISNLIVEDFKSDPTPYINDNGQVGKELRESIKSSAAIQKKDGTSGTLTASSEPYLDSDSGAVKQDILTIQSNDKSDLISGNGSGAIGLGSSSGNGSGNVGLGSGSSNGSSSNNSGNSAGLNSPLPAGKNTVGLQTIDRPDLANDAKPAENNNPNGTGVGTGKSQIGENAQGEENKPSAASAVAASEVGGLDCKEEHQGTLACAQLGSVSESDFDGIEIPDKTNSANYSADNFLPTNGVCPAPKVFHVVGKEYQVSYEPICRIASDIRFAVLIAFAVMSALVAFGGLRKS